LAVTASSGSQLAARALRRVTLATLPTPLTEAPRLAAALGVRSLYVKRDDLTGFAVAGNKARQLEFLLPEADDQGADVLVAGGTAGSNFCTAVAAAARWSDVRCELAIAGNPPSGRQHPNLAAARSWGAHVHWTGRVDRASVDAMIPRLADRLTKEGRRPYAMPRGGATALGAVGYALAARELDAQLADLGIAPGRVVVAVGSGGTLAGLLVGNALLGAERPIVGASVSRPVEEAAARVLDLARRCADLLDAPAVARSDIHLVDARGQGHALPSAAGELAADMALRAAGLVLDPVYTAKALAAVPIAAVAEEGPMVFWHTGGLLDAVAGLQGGG
ncbi:MAG: 1-aminocyclopropane-1-carboxylate deaminase/D-cysteine desulfhydrase, partial [Streptosporangiaceae bacterium]